jgi:hypothetical protein
VPLVWYGQLLYRFRCDKWWYLIGSGQSYARGLCRHKVNPTSKQSRTTTPAPQTDPPVRCSQLDLIFIIFIRGGAPEAREVLRETSFIVRNVSAIRRTVTVHLPASNCVERIHETVTRSDRYPMWRGIEETLREGQIDLIRIAVWAGAMQKLY